MTASCTVTTNESKVVQSTQLIQKTLKKSVSISGCGLFTAESASLIIHPADADTGYVFQRSDIPGNPKLNAQLENVVSTPRCTILGNEHFTIHTVEHILSALRGLGIDNALLELTGPEVPIMDGSAECFVDALVEGGISLQGKKNPLYFLNAPVYWSKEDVHLIALPAKEFCVSYTLHFPHCSVIGSQYLCSRLSREEYIKEIAPSRTFCLYEEIAPFIGSLIKGGGLDNAIIIKDDMILNPEGMRFSDEMVRHKILDLIGDFSLIPFFNAHIIAIRSGHASNIAFAHELLQHLDIMEEA